MNLAEFRLAVRTLPFLDAHANAPEGVLRLRERPQRRLLVWHPEAIEQIFRTDQRLHHPGSRTMKPLLGTKSLLWAEGERYSAYRRLLGPPMHGKRLAGYRGTIAGTVHAAIDELGAGSVFSLPEWTRKVTLEITAKIVLGRADATVLAPFTAWLDDALGSRSRTLRYRYLSGGLPLSGDAFDKHLVRTAKSLRGKDSLASLLLAEDGIEDDELRDQLVSLLFAGHETTASATAWTLFWLDREETVRRDVLAELAATSDDGSDTAAVPLLHAAVQESLRLTPPVPAAGNRVLTEDGELLGTPMPSGTVLTPSIYLAHHSRTGFADPYRFDPHRFLRDRVSPRHFFPFGGGTRHCLGSQLGQLEARMITAAVLRRRELRCVNPKAGVASSRGHAMAPSPKLRMRVRVARCLA